MGKWVAIIVSAILINGMVADASAVDIACEGCAQQQMRAKALALGEGEHRIYSLSTGLAYRFAVTCSGNVPLGNPEASQEKAHEPSEDTGKRQGSGSSVDGVGGPCPFNRPLQVEINPLYPEEKNAFNLAKAFVTAYPPQSGYDLSYDAGGALSTGPWADTVYNVISDYPNRVGLFNEMQQNVPGYQQYLSSLAAGIVAHFGILSNRLLILVKFKDGSSVIIKWDADLQQFSLVPNSAKTETNQPVIEDNSRNFTGNYNIAGVDTDAYFRLLRSMGVEIVLGDRGPSLMCVWKPPVLSCRQMSN